ncbi:MAG TPA: anthrone oxygenase family protein [Polyangiales bacterium]|nr:anthrone oxygenase family protein [Polyangiales bacterium]
MSPWLTGATALACMLMGGVFFTFSSFVMPALGRIPVEEGIRAMQRINIDVYHWTFMGMFFVTPVACIATAVQAFWNANGQAVVYATIGAVVYVLGNFVVTAAGNVPLNNALAAVEPDTVDAARQWSHYLVRWTRWNHVRTAASIIASASFVLALRA